MVKFKRVVLLFSVLHGPLTASGPRCSCTSYIVDIYAVPIVYGVYYPYSQVIFCCQAFVM